MNVELSTVALKLINDLYRTGLFGGSPEDTLRILVEEQLRKYAPSPLLKATRQSAALKGMTK